MRDFLGKYNRNRKKILFVAGMIIAVFAILKIINNFLGKDTYNLESNSKTEVKNNLYETNYSVVSSERVEGRISKDIKDIIKEFINCCNNGNIEEAYNLLSSDCKEVLYPSLEDFRENYYNTNFREGKTYKIQSWITNNNKYIYRVELIEDILTTGKSSDEKHIDYYTIIKNKEEYSLNIGGFVQKNNIDITGSNAIANITITNSYEFVDYLTFNIKVKNKTNEDILLDSGTKSDSVYLIDNKDISYSSFLFEVPTFNLVINRNRTREFEIKFQKEYNKNIKLREIVFADIVANYNTEKEEGNKEIIITLQDK